MSRVLALRVVDSHVHLDAMEEAQRAFACARGALGLYRAMIPGVEPSQWSRALSMFASSSWVDLSVGVHPWEVLRVDFASLQEDWLQELESHLCSGGIAAIGEIGLDAVRLVDGASQQAAEDLFVRQLGVARAAGLPVLLHVVGAHARAAELLKREGRGVRGVVHGFGGSLEEARVYNGLGFFVGLGSLVTDVRRKKVLRTATGLGSEGWLLETDAPYMMLAGARGGRGDSADVLAVLERLSELRGEDVSTLARQAEENYFRMLGV